MVTVFLAEGFEEIEAITPIDILRRGGVELRTCSITASKVVTGAHGIPFTADTLLDELCLIIRKVTIKVCIQKVFII